MRTLAFVVLLAVLSVSQQYDDKNVDHWMRSWLPWWPQGASPLLKAAHSAVKSPLDATSTSETWTATQTAATGEYAHAKEIVPIKSSDKGTVVKKSATSSKGLVLTTPASPLDIGGKDRAFLPFAAIQTELGGLPECPRSCSKGLDESLGLVLKEISHLQRYQQICSNYKESVDCIKDAHCEDEDRGTFEALTSGFKYMCVEQALAFNATIQCINDESGIVQGECEQQCQTKDFLMNWMVRTTMQDTIQQGVNGIVGAATGGGMPTGGLFGLMKAGGPGIPSAPEVPAGKAADFSLPLPEADLSKAQMQQNFENFKQFTGGLCKIGDCALDCIRSKFNARCEGSAGTLLSEVFVRPIAMSQEKLAVLRPILGMFVPEQCAYVYNGAQLAKHRIDSNMDKELKRMYTEKAEKEHRERAQADAALAKLVPLGNDGVPMSPFSTPMKSPLDKHVLSQLIMRAYSENGTKTTPAGDIDGAKPEHEADETNSTQLLADDALIVTPKYAKNVTEIERNGTANETDYEMLETHAFSEESGSGVETDSSGKEGSGSSGESVEGNNGGFIYREGSGRDEEGSGARAEAIKEGKGSYVNRESSGRDDYDFSGELVGGNKTGYAYTEGSGKYEEGSGFSGGLLEGSRGGYIYTESSGRNEDGSGEPISNEGDYAYTEGSGKYEEGSGFFGELLEGGEGSDVYTESSGRSEEGYDFSGESIKGSKGGYVHREGSSNKEKTKSSGFKSHSAGKQMTYA